MNGLTLELIIACSVAIFGLFITGLGFLIVIKRRKFLETSVRTQGTVIKLITDSSTVFGSSPDGDDLSFRDEENMFKGETIAPLISYTSHSGNTFTKKGVGSSKPKYKVGDFVSLFYDVNNPEKAIVDSFLEKWIVSIFVISFGLVILLTGVLLWFLFENSNHHAPTA